MYNSLDIITLNIIIEHFKVVKNIYIHRNTAGNVTNTTTIQFIYVYIRLSFMFSTVFFQLASK